MYKNVPNHQPDCHNVFSGCSRFPKLLTLKIATSPVHVLFPCYCEESHQNRPKDIGYIMSLIPLCRYLRHCWKNPNCEWWKAVKTQQGGHVPPVMFMFHHVSPCFTIQPLRYHTSIPILKHSSGEARVVSRAGRNKSNLPDRCNEATDFPLAKPNIPGDLNRSWQQRIQTVEHTEIELKISMAVLKLTSKLGGPKL
jgi:hypothetical protein